MCGWVKDKFGLSWQITTPIISNVATKCSPEIFGELVKDILKMKKIDISVLSKYEKYYNS